MRKTNIKTVELFAFMLLLSISTIAQESEKFDIITYKSPVGWEKEVGQHAVQFGIAREEANCVITLVKAIPAGPDSRANFDAAWQTLVKDVFAVTDQLEMSDVYSENGWNIESGFAKYESEGIKGIALLFNYSGGEKMVNILILTNTDVFEEDINTFVESIVLPKAAEIKEVPSAINESPIAGTWAKGSGSSIRYGDAVSMGNAGYMKDQYIFNADGTYQFYSKTFRYSMTSLLLVKESGTYAIAGNNLTLTPKKSVIESWSKLNGTDKWGKLLSWQNRTLETTTYQFTKHYFSGIDQWNLVLQSTGPTVRDGPFSGNNTFPNAYYYAPISPNNVRVELP